MDVPDHLSLEHLRGTGLQLGEKAQPEVGAPAHITHVHWQLAVCRRPAETAGVPQSLARTPQPAN